MVLTFADVEVSRHRRLGETLWRSVLVIPGMTAVSDASL